MLEFGSPQVAQDNLNLDLLGLHALEMSCRFVFRKSNSVTRTTTFEASTLKTPSSHRKEEHWTLAAPLHRKRSYVGYANMGQALAKLHRPMVTQIRVKHKRTFQQPCDSGSVSLIRDGITDHSLRYTRVTKTRKCRKRTSEQTESESSSSSSFPDGTASESDKSVPAIIKTYSTSDPTTCISLSLSGVVSV